MPKYQLTVEDGATYATKFLDDGEFLVGFCFAEDTILYNGALTAGGASTLTLYADPQAMGTTAAASAYVYTDSSAATAATVSFTTAAGFVPSPIVGKLCGPIRLVFELDASCSGDTGYFSVITSK